ncbi:MAG TPA: Fe-S cluster assembly protein HesB [Bacteroidota bacterium]|nr:Fe-S cluster assembly protein HesB [Bacteroidota bacterium]
MKTHSLTLTTPSDFHFWRTVYSHGWCSLPPFRVDKELASLHRLLELSDGTLVHCVITAPALEKLKISVQSGKPCSSRQQQEIRKQIRSCFRLDEDYAEFFQYVKHYPYYRWIAKLHTGRLLRSPMVFEDIVKMICTTNCSWALTEIMVNNFVESLGKKFNGGMHSFPTPEAIASTSDAFLRKEIHAGYRAPFLLEFSENVASHKIDIEAFRSENLSTDELYKQLRAIKGVGEYAASNLLRLLGHYDRLGLDSWTRGKYYELHHGGRKVSDTTIEKHYASYGKWRGLIFWSEMTKHWIKQKFPF